MLFLCFDVFFIYLMLIFFFNDTATTEIYTLSLHDALPIPWRPPRTRAPMPPPCGPSSRRSEEHTSELQSRLHLVCRLLLEKKKKQNIRHSFFKKKKKIKKPKSYKSSR